MKRLDDFPQDNAVRSAGTVKMPFLDNGCPNEKDVEKRLQIAEDLSLIGRPKHEIETYKAGLLSAFFFGP